MNYDEYRDFQKKFRTLHRDDMYHVIRENNDTGMFDSMVDIFLMAFAIGFHKKERQSIKGSGAINHVNASALTPEKEDLIILLMLDRHPEIKDCNQMWDAVEEYAEGGIHSLYESLRLSGWVLNIESICN